MNRLGEHSLAYAAFPLDQNCAVSLGRFGRHGQDSPHLSVCTDVFFERMGQRRTDLLGQILVHGPGSLQLIAKLNYLCHVIKDGRHTQKGPISSI